MAAQTVAAPQTQYAQAMPQAMSGAPNIQPYNPMSLFQSAPSLTETIYGRQARAQAEHQQKMALDTYKANVNALSKSLRDRFYAANQMMGLKEKEFNLAEKNLKRQFESNPSPVQIVDLGDGRKEAFVMTQYGHWTHVPVEKNKPSGILKHPVDESGKPVEHIWIDAVTNQRVDVQDPFMQQIYNRPQGGGGADNRPSFKTVEEAQAAKLDKGTKILIGGRPATVN